MPSNFDNKNRLPLPQNTASDLQYFCIPIPVDPEYAAVWIGALRRMSNSSMWEFEDTHKRFLIADWWEQYWILLQSSFEPCGEFDGCRTHLTSASNITYYPCSPFLEACDLPEGYTYAPFTLVDNSLIGTIIGQWGLGYRIGDVYTDLTKLPQGSWSNVLEGYNFFPRINVATPAGEGSIKITFLNIPQGGRALILVDDDFDLLHLRLVELNKDLISVPSETQVPFTVEYPVTGEGFHEVKIIFLPTVDDTPLPIFFGGGLRSIELCGFDMAVENDPCCPDEQFSDDRNAFNDWVMNNSNMQLTNSMYYDGTPESIYSNAGENFNSEGDGILCDAIAMYVSNLMTMYAGRAAIAGALAGFIASALILIGAALAPFSAGTTAVLGVAAAGAISLTVAAWIAILQDMEAQRLVRCCMYDNLKDTALTQANFKTSANTCPDITSGNAETLRATIDASNQMDVNWTAFLRALNMAAEGSADNCECGCEESEIDIVAETPQTTITRLSDTTFQIDCSYRPGTDPAYPDAVMCQIRTSDFRCVNMTFTEAQSDSNTTRCDGTIISVTGGGGGDAYRVNWRKTDGIAVDTILTIICIEP